MRVNKKIPFAVQRAGYVLGWLSIHKTLREAHMAAQRNATHFQTTMEIWEYVGKKHLRVHCLEKVEPNSAIIS